MKTEKVKSEYEIQAEKFLEETKTEFREEYVGHDFYFDDDKEKRDIYRILLSRNGKDYTFRFGQSVNGSMYGVTDICPKCRALRGAYIPRHVHLQHNHRIHPTAYDVLVCLIKSDPGTIDDFQIDYGYSDEKASKVIKTYNAVVDEWKNVRRLFWDVLEKLQEIN